MSASPDPSVGLPSRGASGLAPLQAEQHYRQVRDWADETGRIADILRDTEATLDGEDWVELNAIAEELERYANDLQMELSRGG